MAGGSRCTGRQAQGAPVTAARAPGLHAVNQRACTLMPNSAASCCCRIVLCSSLDATESDHTSSASTSTLMSAGSLPRQQYNALVSTMHGIIQEQQARKQKDRAKGVGSGHGRSHYQCTPAFILSAVKKAITKLAAQEKQQANGTAQQVAGVPFTPPRGGFTDVGQHTRSQPRATTWPLLLSVFKVRPTACVPQSVAHAQRIRRLWT